MQHIWKSLVVAFFVLFAYSLPSAAATSYLAQNTQYSQSQIQSFFENSGNSYLSSNAATFAAMSYKVESGGNSAIYNGSCCTGLMQMNKSNLNDFCECTSAEYAALSGQDQINIYARYYESAGSASSVNTLLEMQANGQTLGGYQVDGAMIASCIQLGVGNCQKSINNGCSGVSSAEGGDGNVNICTMASKANGGTGGGGGGGGGGGQIACLVPLMKDNGIQLMSPYGADRSHRAGASKGMHQGLDIVNGFTQGNAEDNPIYAGHGGKTTFRLNGAGGNYVAIRAPNDLYNTVYYHLAHKDLDTFRQKNPTVQPGATIGYMGNTGTSGEGSKSGIHLHLGMTVKGSVLQSAGGGGRIMATGGCPTCGTKSRPPLSSSEISNAAADSWYFVNPEPFLDKQIPVPEALRSGYPGYFSERADPSKTLPTTCSLDPSIAAGQPMSTGSGTSVSNAESGLGSYRNEGEDFATSQVSGDTRSIYLDLARVNLDELQAANLSMSSQNQLASTLAHMIVTEQRTK